jgi:Ornithine cyclodeaminase/mu-crystallin family/Redoxin
VEEWDLIPGARGCTPESCGFRDHYAELARAGADVVGLSTQDTDYQCEAAARLNLPFPLVSDAELRLTRAMRLPTFEIAGQRPAQTVHAGDPQRARRARLLPGLPARPPRRRSAALARSASGRGSPRRSCSIATCGHDSAPLTLSEQRVGLSLTHIGACWPRRHGCTPTSASGVSSSRPAATPRARSDFASTDSGRASRRAQPCQSPGLSPTRENREAFARRAEAALGLSAAACDSAEEAVADSDLVVLATRSERPVIEADWIRPGTHVNTVGPKLASAHETPPELAESASTVVTDSPEQAPGYGEPFFTPRAVTHLGGVLTGDSPGRISDEDIILYCSTGLAGSEVVLAETLLATVEP